MDSGTAEPGACSAPGHYFRLRERVCAQNRNILRNPVGPPEILQICVIVFRSDSSTERLQRDRKVSRNKINELLSERHQRFTPLQRLLRQAGNQESWTAEFCAVLPASLARECRVTDIRGPEMVVACRNAASATKLRFMAPDILERLRPLAAFHEVRELRIRVSS